MYVIGIVIIINSAIFPWFLVPIPSKCGCDDKYICSVTYTGSLYHSFYTQWISFTAYAVISWVFVLLLYIVILLSIKKRFTNSQSNDKIMGILHRILILTIIYEVIGLGGSFTHVYHIKNPTNFAYILNGTMNGLLSTTLSFSMFLMQDHNTTEYKKFLNILYKLRLHNCLCCCFRLRIKKEVEEYLKTTKDVESNGTATLSVPRPKTIDKAPSPRPTLTPTIQTQTQTQTHTKTEVALSQVISK